MKYLVIFFLTISYSLGAVWSNTQMSIATGAISAVVASNMAVFQKQISEINKLYGSQALAPVSNKDEILLDIEGLEAAIMIEMRKISANQKEINVLFSK